MKEETKEKTIKKFLGITILLFLAVIPFYFVWGIMAAIVAISFWILAFLGFRLLEL